MKKVYNVIDLFCGAGGLSEGFQQAGYKVLLGIDNIDVFIKTFKQNHKDAEGIAGDITKIGIPELRKLTNNKKIHVIVGGPPCQGFSGAGRRDSKDPRNSLFMDFARIVDGIKPDYFVMENVPGILTMKTAHGKPVKEIIESEFANIGYNVKIQKMVAADYGVPQRRIRVVFIGTNTGKKIEFPVPTHSNNKQLNIESSNLKPWVGVGTVLEDRENVPENYFHSKKMIEGFKKRKEYNKLKGNGFGWQILDLNKPSYTISARYYKDGADAIVKYSDWETRMLTEKEAATIQTFPKSYQFAGSKRDVYTQIGNAVPVKMASAIANIIKKNLSN